MPPRPAVCLSPVGMKRDELSNHRGNVMTVISDKIAPIDTTSDGLWDYFNPSLVSATDYYPFGMGMPGRVFRPTDYRFGFNGQEKDDEIKGSGNSYDFLFRIYDPRLGRFLSVDPLAKDYPWNSTYAYAENRPIDGKDLEGKEYEHYLASQIVKNKGVSALKVINTDHGWGPVVKASYNLQVHGSAEAYRNLVNAYTTDPGILHNPNNSYAQYTPMKQSSTIQKDDHMKINVEGMGGVVNWDIYVRFTDVQVNENSFSITASTLYGHTDAGFINFSGSFDPETGNINFSIYNETTNNVGADAATICYGRMAQTSQWKIVLNNVESTLGGTTNSKTLHKEISIQNAQKGDGVKVINENLQTGSSSETYKEK